MIFWYILAKEFHNEFRRFDDCTTTFISEYITGGCTVTETYEFIAKPFGLCVPDDHDLFI